jgi:hypothetical protein
VVPNGCKLGRDSVSFLLEEYAGPCNIFANCYLIKSGDTAMQFFAFDSSLLNIRNTVSRFDLS